MVGMMRFFLFLVWALVPALALAQETASLQPVKQPQDDFPFDTSYLEEIEESLRESREEGEATWSKTGEALWDAFVEAMEQQFLVPPPRNETIDAPYLTDAVLAEWEERFSGDPRYWQLRYWNATYALSAGVEGEVEPISFVRTGLERGAVDAEALWLLYQDDLSKLDEIEQRFVNGSSTPADLAVIAEAETPTPYTALSNLRIEIARKLTEALPDESRAWYELAFRKIEIGDWDGGLAAMARGNAAPSNRRLDPFPLSFVKRRIMTGASVGSAAVAGAVMARAYTVVPIRNFIRPKDHTRELQIRLNLGADVSEVDVWHRWAMRNALMEGSDSLDCLVMVVISGILTKHLVIDLGGSLTPDQRENLWQLNGRIRGVTEMIRRENDAEISLSEYLEEHLGLSAGELAEQLISNSLWPPTDEEFQTSIEDLREFLPDSTAAELAQLAEASSFYGGDHAVFEIRRLLCEWSYAAAVEEHAGETAIKIRERFAGALDFDFTTLRWKS